MIQAGPQENLLHLQTRAGLPQRMQTFGKISSCNSQAKSLMLAISVHVEPAMGASKKPHSVGRNRSPAKRPIPTGFITCAKAEWLCYLRLRCHFRPFNRCGNLPSSRTQEDRRDLALLPDRDQHVRVILRVRCRESQDQRHGYGGYHRLLPRNPCCYFPGATPTDPSDALHCGDRHLCRHHSRPGPPQVQARRLHPPRGPQSLGCPSEATPARVDEAWPGHRVRGFVLAATTRMASNLYLRSRMPSGVVEPRTWLLILQLPFFHPSRVLVLR